LGLHWIKVNIFSLSQGDLFCADLLKVNSDEKVAIIYITTMEKGRGDPHRSIMEIQKLLEALGAKLRLSDATTPLPRYVQRGKPGSPPA
jgi:hypothetical protein